MLPSESFVEANGVRLHCLTWMPPAGGQAGLPPLVLLHANGFLARLWQPVAERLAERFQVFAYDIRGHGDSDKPDPADPGNYHWQHLIDDLRAFLDAFALRGVPMVGHSSGGATAAGLAGTQPEYFSRLVLIEPIIMPPQFATVAGPRAQMADAARRRRQVWPRPDDMFDAYQQRPAFARWRPDVLRLYAEHGTFRREDGQVQLKCSGEVEARMFENSASLNIWDLLPDIQCPTLVIKGRHTDAFLGQIVEDVAGHVPGAHHLTVEDAGHLVPMEQPERLSAVIEEFLAEAP